MAKEYNDNRQSIGVSGIIGSEEVPLDVVRGWQIRNAQFPDELDKTSNNVHLSELIPFVQLIGLYNEEVVIRLK